MYKKRIVHAFLSRFSIAISSLPLSSKKITDISPSQSYHPSHNLPQLSMKFLSALLLPSVILVGQVSSLHAVTGPAVP